MATPIEETFTENWIKNDAVLFDVPEEEIILQLIYEGHDPQHAIDLVEEYL
jgi:hypothetical protein